MALLEVSKIDVFYGRVQAIRGLSISVGAGEIVALIGSNGAGKTTTLRTISGLMHPAGGKISFDGRDLTQTKAHEIVRIGICQSPEGRRLFPRMIVLDNLLMGTYARKERSGIQSDLARVYELFPRLKERTKQLAGTLSGGEQANYEAYVVGGKVRDAVLGVESRGAWDLTTSATPEEIQKLFRSSYYFNRFGTVTVRSGDEEVEVTTYRTEADYTDHRRPDHVSFTRSLREDLSRRDFTMNAMAWRPAVDDKPGELVDPFGGQRDLEARIIRAVGDPRERFAEDALRMLRAVRFATRLGFMIDPRTADAIRDSGALARNLSGERVQQEMTKMLWAQ